MPIPVRHVCLLLSCLLPTTLLAADETFTSNGVTIRYVTEGQGTPVVLVHGWMANSSMWGGDLVGNTKLRGVPGYQLIALDCRGHGKSDKPHDAAMYGKEQALDIVRLLDHLQIKKAHLVGYSSGSFIIGHVAANHPERVLSVIYAAQAPIITGHIKPADFSECESFAKIVDSNGDLGKYLIDIWPADKPKLTEPAAKAMAKLMYGGKDLKAFAYGGTTFRELAVSIEQLKKCTAPTLFIHGANESAHVKNRVKLVHGLLGHGEVKLIEGGDHVTTLMKPEFGKAIVEFWKK